MSLLFWPQRKPIATFDTSKYDVSYPGMGVVIARQKAPSLVDPVLIHHLKNHLHDHMLLV